MVHLNQSTKDQTFLLRDGWRLIYQGRVPNAIWAERGPAEAALSLLQKGYLRINEGGIIIVARAKN